MINRGTAWNPRLGRRKWPKASPGVEARPWRGGVEFVPDATLEPGIVASEREIMNPGLRIVLEIFLQTAFIVLLVGSATGLLLGLMLMLDRERVFRLNERMNRWVSTRVVLRPLEQPRSVNLHLYRRHRLVGVGVCVAALYSLLVLLFNFELGPIVHVFRDLGRPETLAWLVESVRIFLVAGNSAVLLAGILLVVRPAAVRKIAAWADRHYSDRRPTKPLEEMNYGPDRFIRSHPVLVGTLLIVGCVYVLLNLGLFRWT
jgi:hypothetical protein